MERHLRTSEPSKRRPAAILAALLLSVVLGAAACGGSSTSTSTTTAAAKTTSGKAAATSNTITIDNFAYSPTPLRVKPGTKVAVHNADTVTHTLTATSPHSGAFNTGDISPGTTKYFTAPKTAGTYPYICMIHQFMHGTLIVT